MNAAILCLDGWAGRHDVRVEITGETPSRYYVRLLEDTRLPGRWRQGFAGEIVRVPKNTVRLSRD